MAVINISADELKRMVAAGSVELIDVRESGEFREGHIESAKLIPMGEVEKRTSEIDWSKQVVFYCRSGARSAFIAGKIAKASSKTIYNLMGGILSWSAF